MSGSPNGFGTLKPTNQVEFPMPDNILKRWQKSMNESVGESKQKTNYPE